MAQSIASVMDRIETAQATVISIGPNANSLELLQAIYRNPSIPLPTRIRCAVAALPHEFPRLQVTAQIQDNNLATLLDERIKRMEERTKVIEAPTNGKVVATVEVKPPMPRLADRRFRCISRNSI